VGANWKGERQVPMEQQKRLIKKRWYRVPKGETGRKRVRAGFRAENFTPVAGGKEWEFNVFQGRKNLL